MKIVAEKSYLQVPREFFESCLTELSLEQMRVYMLLILLVSDGTDNLLDDLSLKLKIDKAVLIGILKQLSNIGLIVMDDDGMIFLPEHPDIHFTSDNRHGTCQLVSDAEQIKGSVLTNNEVSLLFYLKDMLSFSDELICYLCSYCKKKGCFAEPYIRKVALSWHDNKISSPEEAAAFISGDDDIVCRVLKHLGRSGTPTEAERTYISRWKDILGASDDIILHACDITAVNTDRNRLQYASKIIEHFSSKGITTVDDALRLEGERKERNTSSKNAFNNFEQRSNIDFEALEKLLLDN